MRKTLLLLALSTILAAPSLFAQQDAQFSMYMFNRMTLNPAYAGARNALNITAVGRSQWVGIDGHPNTFTLSADGPVDLLHGGIGGHFIFDEIGPMQTIGARLAYAFRFDFGGERGEGSSLQLGIAPGIFSKQIDGTNFLPENQADPRLVNIIGQTAGKSVFDLGAGIYFNTPGEKLYLGAAVDHILEPQLDVVEGLDETNLPLTVSAMAGYRIGREEAPVSVTPSAMFKMAGSQMQIDANVNVEVSPMVFGISYRGLANTSDIVGIVGFNANQRLFVAYSYDYTLSELQSSTSGSHEILLSYTFPRLTRFYPPNLDTMDNPIVR